MKIFAVIAAGGAGTRCGGKLPKQFLNLGDRAVIDWSISAFLNCRAVAGVLVAAPAEFCGAVREMYRSEPRFLGAVPGGATREESVGNALNALSTVAEGSDAVLIHDAARPGVSPELIKRCIGAARIHPAAVAAVPVADTLYMVKGDRVDSVSDRAAFRAAQTPQCFNFGRIMRAFERAERNGDWDYPDDVSLYRRYGDAKTVHIVEGEARNFKITGAVDLELARALLAEFSND